MNEQKNEQKNADIDYEHMDDLPLNHRAEWTYFEIDEEMFDSFDNEHVVLQAN